MSDVVAIERTGPTLPEQHLRDDRPGGGWLHADAPALSFFLRAQDHERPTTWDYATLFASITATANFFHSLGIGKDDVIAFVLPNLPETHLTIWGGQAAGIVFAINPLLEPAAIGELLKAGEAKVLVTLAPFPGIGPVAEAAAGDRRRPRPAAPGAGRPGAASAGRRPDEAHGRGAGRRGRRRSASWFTTLPTASAASPRTGWSAAA